MDAVQKRHPLNLLRKDRHGSACNQCAHGVSREVDVPKRQRIEKTAKPSNEGWKFAASRERRTFPVAGHVHGNDAVGLTKSFNLGLLSF